MIVVYSKQDSPRLQYIVKFLFTGILQVPAKITTNLEEFKLHNGPKINYSFSETEGITILPKSLLFKTKFEDIVVEVAWDKETPLLFHECADVELPFDPFAASFYMISRYEEYINKDTDIHGRFLSASSIAVKNGFISIPVVDIWALKLRDIIGKYHPTFVFPERKHSFIPTIDVDSVAFTW